MSYWNDWRKLHWQIRLASSIGRIRGRRPLAAIPRVLHLSPSWFADASYVGGGERYPTELARAMADLVPTTLLSFSPSSGRAKEGLLEFRWLEGRPLNGNVSDPMPGSGLIAALSACDVLHAHQWRTAATQLAVAWASALGKRIYVTDHGNRATDLDARYRLAGLVDGFLPVSRFGARFLPCPSDSPGLGGGVPPGLLHEAPGAWPRERRVVFLGRLLPHKGLDLLIQACGPEIPLTLIGRAYDEGYLADLRSLARNADVEFVCDAADPEVARRLRTATVLALPSVHRDLYGRDHEMPELLGLVLLEAMACGTPVVCSTAGGMPEFVRDGVTGFVVPWGDDMELRRALLKVLDDPSRAAEMGRAARREVETRHNWSEVARRALGAYRNEGPRFPTADTPCTRT